MQLPLPQLLPAVLCRLHRQAEQVAQILHLADGAAPLQLADHHRGRQQTGGKGVGFRLLCGAVALVAAADVPQLVGNRPTPPRQREHTAVVQDKVPAPVEHRKAVLALLAQKILRLHAHNPGKMLHRIDHNLAAALQTKGIDRQRKTPLPQQQLDRQDVCPVSVVHRKSPAFHLL